MDRQSMPQQAIEYARPPETRKPPHLGKASCLSFLSAIVFGGLCFIGLLNRNERDYTSGMGWAILTVIVVFGFSLVGVALGIVALIQRRSAMAMWGIVLNGLLLLGSGWSFPVVL